jgi:RecA-family ATPase
MNAADLIALIEPLARRFFGEPDPTRSRGNVLYFGSRGQLEVDVKQGRWFDHDTQKSGGPLDFIKQEIGCASDDECLEWLAREGLWTNSGGIPADTMQIIRDGVEDDKQRSRAFWSVLIVLKRHGLTVNNAVELLEAHRDGLAKKYRGRLRHEVERAYRKIKQRRDDDDPDAVPVLRSYFIEELEKQPVEPVEWLVEDFIPANTLTGFFGDGGTGKDRTLLLLAAAVACNQLWLGKKVKHGRALYYNVEDDDKELNRRRAAIADYYGIGTFATFSERLKITPLVGKDTVLAVFDRERGVVRPTPLFESVRREIAAFKPTLVIVGNRVNIFSVDQNSDTQARQCLGLLFGVTTEFVGTTVIMPGHVSLSGMASRRGDSGTVQWSNGCRARLLLDRITKESGDEPDQDARVLQVKKANWGPDKNEIKLRWSRGLFIPDTGDIEPERIWSFGDVAALLKDEDEFLRMLDIVHPLKVSPYPTAQNNAAKIFSEDSRCKLKGRGVRAKLKAAMERLQAKGKIEVAETGPQSRRTPYIRRVERGVVVDFPSGKPAPASEQPQGNGSEPGAVASVPFMMTHAQKRELGLLGYSDEQILEMTPQQGQDIIARRRKLAGVLTAWSAIIGPGHPRTVEQVFAAAEMAGTTDGEASDDLKRALAAVTNGADKMPLEQWLLENSGIEVGQLTLRQAGSDGDGRTQWMLELRVEPDRGPDAD